MSRVVTVQEAAAHINDNDTLAISGMLFIAGCEPFYEALEERFLQTGKPSNLTMFAATSIGARYNFDAGWPPDQGNRLAHHGLVKRVITSHYGTMPLMQNLINECSTEGYLLPQGTFSQIISAAARRIPRTLTKMGLHTFVDPRYGGGKLNDACNYEFCELTEIDGEEFLSYKTIYPDVCIIRGTTVDKNGNITFEEECSEFDALQMAMATKNNGGTVIVQVKRQSEERANPALVKLPERLVDYVYIYPRQSLRLMGRYDPKMNGMATADAEDLCKAAEKVSKENRAILERACKELRPGAVVNLGVGMPHSIAVTARRLGMDHGVTFTNEVGIWGGHADPAAFGLNFNTDCLMSQGDIQNFYEGGGLDISFAGALEVDARGNVNVMRSGMRIFGIGGFNSITANAGTVVFCLNFFGKDGKCKIVDDVEYINYNAVHKPTYQRAMYITDRCTFALENGLLKLQEIYPNYSTEDVLPYLPKNILI